MKLLWMSLFLSIQASSTTPFTDHLIGLTSEATSLKDFERRIEVFREYEEKRAICQFELLQNIPPVNCYKPLQLQVDYRNFTQKEAELKVRQLDFQCQRSTNKAHSVEVLRAKLKIKNEISSACREAINAKLEELQYQKEETLKGLLEPGLSK